MLSMATTPRPRHFDANRAATRKRRSTPTTMAGPIEALVGLLARQGRVVTRQLIPYSLAGLLGALYVAVLSWLYGPTSDTLLMPVFVVSFFSMLAASFLLGRVAVSGWPIGALVFAGICAGVLANAIYDLIVNHVDHNLFPIEIILMTTLALPGVIAGTALAWSVRTRNLK